MERSKDSLSPAPTIPTAALPVGLRAAVSQAFDDFAVAQPLLATRIAQSSLAAQFALLVAGSDYALGIMKRRPEAGLTLIEEDRIAADAVVVPAPAPEMNAAKAQFMADLRQLRHREMLGIVWRDLCGYCATAATLAATSALADALITVASDYARRTVPGASDVPPPIILAMGKLGGRELNFSSDVDLIFLYPDERQGGVALYTRHARRVIELLDQRTEHGFVYRVDTRLRPFGASGALCASLDAFDSYLQSHGREWERYAYIKARAVTGTAEDIKRLKASLRGFVYRRYLDYGLFDSLRDMKRLIEQDVARRAVHDDVKRGDGGIREIEFIVQALQIVRGGSQTQLQTASLAEAMTSLVELGFLSASAGRDLADAYEFLRRTENRLQMWRDAQTHRLPGGEDQQLRLAATMGYDSWPAFAAALAARRRTVSGHFASLLRPVGDEAPETDNLGYRLWHGLIEDARVAETLRAAGVDDADAVAAALARIRGARSVAQLDTPGRRRLDRLMPGIIERAALRPDGGTLFPRVLEIIEGVGRRSAYFSLLNENPQALANLVSLCGQSVNIARQVAANPLLLDSLIDPAVVELPTPAARRRQLHEHIVRIAEDDLEALIETLAHFKQSALFEVAVADLSETLAVMKVSDHITSTAETVLHEVHKVARRWLRERHGEPLNDAGEEAQFCIIGYGKLGGIELGYGSDLDLVFLFDCGDGDPSTPGPRSVPASVYFARLVQRIAHIAGATTRFGSLYEVDMRLRPSGSSGALVSSFGAFERYQRHEAWTWEHQALLRARAVAGDPELATRFEDLRRSILLSVREPEGLAKDILKMRERLRAAHPSADGRKYNLKHAPGGLLDTEFLMQYWLLRDAHAHPALIEYSDHMRQLDALVAAGTVPDQICREVQSIYLAYRTAAHRMTLLGQPLKLKKTRFRAERETIEGLWREYLPATEVS